MTFDILMTFGILFFFRNLVQYTSYLEFIWNFCENVVILCIVDTLYFDKSINRCMDKCMYLYCNCHVIGMRMCIHIECVFILYRENVPKTYSCVHCLFCAECIIFCTKRNSGFKSPVATSRVGTYVL